LVAALYYPFETERSNFRNRLSTRQHIVLGDYDAINYDIVTRHLEYSRQANIGVWMAEWNGKDTTQDNLLRTEILTRQNDLEELQLSILYNVRGRVNTTNTAGSTAWNYSQVQTDLEHFFMIIAPHDHYLTLQGRPVLVLSLTRWFYAKLLRNNCLHWSNWYEKWPRIMAFPKSS
jgi:hypothetical protein